MSTLIHSFTTYFSTLDARRQRPEEQVLARIFMVFTLLMILWLLIS